ncbi:MAG: hypothetical protein J5999_09715 [Oscillospiraceae bacterium]|nr:hypothetical protein [Oscillospiraceae bacterium]
MKKYLSDYIAFIEKALADNSLSREEMERIFDEMPLQIGFMQHERLIHLIVTVLFALLLFIAMTAAAALKIPAFFLLSLLLLALLIPYISHYYFLENNVQKLYSLYNALNDKIKKSHNP